MIGAALICCPALAQQLDLRLPQENAQQAPQQVLPHTSPQASLTGVITLDPKLLVQLVVSHSAEVQYSRMQIEVAGELSAAEAALYETVFFSSLRYEDRERQRGVEERVNSIATSNLLVLDENVQTAEAGVRNRLPSGAEVSFSYRLRDKSNNIISNATGDKEFDGALVLTLRQPLLRGRGRDVVETDRKVAEVEHSIARLQFQQQLLKTSNDALAIYWQLYRAQQVRRIRAQALEYAHRVRSDTGARIEAGKLANSNMIEADAAVLLREVEHIRSEQGVREAESRLYTLLNVSGLENQSLRLEVREGAPVHIEPHHRKPEERYRTALENWPAFRIARLRSEQANLRLNFADNQRLPLLDLVASRSNTGLASSNKRAREITESGDFPDWYVGLNFEMPLGGNQKAQSQYRAQASRVRQAELELESIHKALANEIGTRWQQAAGAREEVARMRRDVELRAELLRIEQVRYEAGMGLLAQLLQRETELSDSRQRLVESNARLGQANDALLFADGSLLQQYGITLKE